MSVSTPFQPIPFDAEFDLPAHEVAPPPVLALPPGDFWVFGYGSLMWDPGFPFETVEPVTVRGWHRAFCIWSQHYRGTRERPGLVLGLQRGGACRGRAFRVAASHREAVLDYLYRRELINGVYEPRIVRAQARDAVLPTLAFTANPRHSEYAGHRSLEETAAIMAVARGRRGPNRDYLANTVRHLDELGLPDGPLHRLLALVEALPPEGAVEA
jgi:cation transport protein ChaC